MKTPRMIALHTAALLIASLRGIAEFTALQRWRLHERMARR
jgi:hypothetical protein